MTHRRNTEKSEVEINGLTEGPTHTDRGMVYLTVFGTSVFNGGTVG